MDFCTLLLPRPSLSPSPTWSVDAMSKRRSNQLPNNLPQLQNLIKRDPGAYKEEVSADAFRDRYIYALPPPISPSHPLLVLVAAPSLQGTAAAVPSQSFSDIKELSRPGHVPQSSALANLAFHSSPSPPLSLSLPPPPPLRRYPAATLMKWEHFLVSCSRCFNSIPLSYTQMSDW